MKVRFDPENEEFSRALELLKEGNALTCHVCGADMKISPPFDLQKSDYCIMEISCPADPGHGCRVADYSSVQKLVRQEIQHAANSTPVNNRKPGRRQTGRDILIRTIVRCSIVSLIIIGLFFGACEYWRWKFNRDIEGLGEALRGGAKSFVESIEPVVFIFSKSRSHAPPSTQQEPASKPTE